MRRRVIVVVMAIAVVLAGLALLVSRSTNDKIVIAGGSPAGLFAYATEKLATNLRAHGFEVEVLPVLNTTDGIKLVQDPDSPINVALMAMPITPDDFPDVYSVGTFARLPVGILVEPPADGHRPNIRELKGHTIEVGAPGTMRRAMSVSILAEYGITEENSTFLGSPSRVAVQNVEDGKAEAFITLLDQQDPAVADWAKKTRLLAIIIDDAAGLSARNGFTSPAVIPVGAFGLNPPIPAMDFPTVAVPTTLVVGKGLGDGAVYALARYLSEEYDRGSITSVPGEFPNFSDRQLPPRGAAKEYYDTGEIPWQYSVFPTKIADLFVPIVILLSLFLVLATFYQLLFPDSYSLWTTVFNPRRELKAIASLEEALAKGKDLSVRQRNLLTKILAEQDEDLAVRQRADALRSHLNDSPASDRPS